jgi:hypothetical protein
VFGGKHNIAQNAQAQAAFNYPRSKMKTGAKPAGLS